MRLSRAAEESTSVERQREIIETWAKQNDHEIVAWAEDTDVSGSVDPFKTPELGPWLTDEKKHEWDIVCAWKLDRMGRDAIKLNKLFGWALDNSKTVVSATEGIDLSTPVGRLIANVIAFLAEGERDAIRERTIASQKKLRELGRWGGGKPYYGFKAVPREDGAGWELVPDEHSSKVLLRIIDKVLDGQSTESIARELNEAGELSPSNYLRHRAGKPTRRGKWSNAHIRQQLRSQTLLGQTAHFGTTVRDAQGIPISKGPALVSRDVFDRLQAALDARSFKVTNRSAKASPLLGVAFCGMCGRLMHLRQHHNKARGKTYRYYQCVGGASGNDSRHETNIIKADDLELLVKEGFLSEYGHENVREQVFVPAENHQTELEELQRAVEETTPLMVTTPSETARKSLLAQISVWTSRMAELEKLPASESRYEVRRLPETYDEAWEKADTEGRRQLLLKTPVAAMIAVRGRVSRQNPGFLDFHIYVGKEPKDRLSHLEGLATP